MTGAPCGSGPHRQRPALPIQSALPVTEAFRPEYLSYYRILPLAVEEGRLRVAVAGAPNPGALDDLRQSYGLDLALEAVDDGELQDAIRRTFAAPESVLELVRHLDAAVDPLYSSLPFQAIFARVGTSRSVRMGAKILEVNYFGDIDLPQHAYRRGFLDDKLIALMKSRGLDLASSGESACSRFLRLNGRSRLRVWPW